MQFLTVNNFGQVYKTIAAPDEGSAQSDSGANRKRRNLSVGWRNVSQRPLVHVERMEWDCSAEVQLNTRISLRYRRLLTQLSRDTGKQSGHSSKKASKTHIP